MQQTVRHLTLDLPDDYASEETMVTLRARPKPELADPRSLQKKITIVPNLIVHVRPKDDGEQLNDAAGYIYEELRQKLNGAPSLKSESFSFDDGAEGVLVSYEFKARKEFSVRQYSAIRIDGDHVTTLTFTVPTGPSVDVDAKNYITYLRSARLS